MHLFLERYKELLELLLLAATLGIDVFFVGASLGTSRIHTNKVKSFLIYVGLFHFLFSITSTVLGAYLHKRIGDLSEIIGGLVILTTGGYLWFGALEKKKSEYSAAKVAPNMFTLALGSSIECLSVGLGIALHIHYVITIAYFITIIAVLSSYLGVLSGRKIGTYFGVASEFVGAGCLTLIGVLFLCW